MAHRRLRTTLWVLLGAVSMLFAGYAVGRTHDRMQAAAGSFETQRIEFQRHDATQQLAVSGSQSVERAPAAEPRQAPGAAVETAPADAPFSFRGVAQEVLPVVVEVNTVEVIRQTVPRFPSPWDFFGPRQPQQPEEREFRRPGLGSGVIVRRDGSTVYVLTNNHVVGDAREIGLKLYDGREYEAEIVGKDSRTDLALVRFETRDEVPIARLGDSDSLYVGDWVLAVGNPLGFESTVTAGIVSALGRRPQPGSPIAGFTDYIQTDASINPGNSGGALADVHGNIVGINTWIASRSGGSVGLGFAIPINNARRAIDDFIEQGRIVYGWLGVSIQDVRPQSMPGLAADLGIEAQDGALVINVHRDSPAARGGIRPGDFVTRIDNRPVSDSTEMTRIVGNIAPGRRADFAIIRAGRQQTLSVTLDRRGTEDEVAAPSGMWPGMAIVPLTESMREAREIDEAIEGVLVASVLQDGPAAISGIRNGDVVTQVNGTLVHSARDFYRALAAASGEILFRVNRSGVRIVVGMDAL
ncbi:MAG: Do family serine endopeptidase [Spirochaetaceae bacterium]|nr:MAG: Do family serine endopeptidase [Spirochaetaceae bacterium]